MAKLTEFEKNIAERIKEQIDLNKDKPTLGSVRLDKAIELLKEAGAILLDVRPPAKVEGENAEEADIPDSYYTPYPEFTNYLDILPDDKTTPIITACVKGYFANRTKAYLELLGYENVFALDGNIEDWILCHKAHKGEL